jgi:hypothetical protein
LHFFLIQKLNTKTLKSTSGERERERERERESEIRGESFWPDLARETVFPVRSGTKRFRPERFFGEKGISSRERYFPTRFGRESV